MVHPTVTSLACVGRHLWHDILQALGAAATRSRALRATRQEQERAVHAALQSAGACQLTVLRAHRMGSGLWADLVHLHRTTNANLVLVHHAELPDDLAHLLCHCDHCIIDTFAGMERLHPFAVACVKS